MLTHTHIHSRDVDEEKNVWFTVIRRLDGGHGPRTTTTTYIDNASVE